MTNSTARRISLAALISAVFAMSACSTDQAIDNSVGVAAGTAKVVAKGAVGAGKLAYKGGQAVLGSGD